MTALIVARPLVAGEDPGLLAPLSSTTNLVLTLLWLVAVLGWAVWRAWSGDGSWYASWVELGLFGVVACAFLSAGTVAAYKHPAFLIAWEWLVVLAAFCLVRQLARTDTDNHGLLAALLATAVSIAVLALWQTGVGSLAERGKPSPSRNVLAEVMEHGDYASPESLQFAQDLRAGPAPGTRGRPSTFAGYLSLLLPAAAGYAVMSWRTWRWAWQTYLTGGCFLILGAALLVTHRLPALLAVLLVSAGVAVICYRWRLLTRAGSLLGCLAVIAAIAGLILFLEGGGSGPGQASLAMRSRWEAWTVTWSMIHDHWWLGVGPGNFSRSYPRYLPSSAWEKVGDPQNLALEMWATCGVFALAALVVAFAAFFWRVWSVVSSPWSVVNTPMVSARTDEQKTSDHGPRTPWEFYVGGMSGLLLGFLLRLTELPAQDILKEGLAAGMRSLIWFTVFALLFDIRLPGPARVLVLSAGVAALLLNLTVSAGIGLPAVAQPLWITAALMFNALPQRPFLSPRYNWLSTMLPLPLCAVLCLVFFTLIFQPVAAAGSSLRAARGNFGPFLLLRSAVEQERDLQVLAVFTPSPFAPSPAMLAGPGSAWAHARIESNGRQRAIRLLNEEILTPLVEAVNADPADAALKAQLARWYGELWNLDPQAQSTRLKVDAGKAAVTQAARAMIRDPEGRDGYLAEYRLRKRFAERSSSEIPEGKKKSQKQEQYELAVAALYKVVERDPTEARLHYQLADLLFRIGDKDSGHREAEAAWTNDQQASDAGRRLTDRQREQVRQWINPSLRT